MRVVRLNTMCIVSKEDEGKKYEGRDNGQLRRALRYWEERKEPGAPKTFPMKAVMAMVRAEKKWGFRVIMTSQT